jgi:hypothetical protein
MWLLWAVLPVLAALAENRRLGRRRFLMGIAYNALHLGLWGLLAWALVRSILVGDYGGTAAFALILIALGLSGLAVRWVLAGWRKRWLHN